MEAINPTRISKLLCLLAHVRKFAACAVIVYESKRGLKMKTFHTTRFVAFSVREKKHKILCLQGDKAGVWPQHTNDAYFATHLAS